MRRLFSTLPGRMFILSAVLRVALALWGLARAAELPPVFLIFRQVVSLALIASSVSLVAQLVERNRGKLFWRVRRKLILSYLFFGFIPVLLVVVFALVGGLVLYDNVAAYLFRQGLDDVVDEVHQMAETAAIEIERAPTTAQAVIDRRYQNRLSRYPELSLAVVPVVAAKDVAWVTAGAWRHLDAPKKVPKSVLKAHGFGGTLAVAGPTGVDGRDEIRLFARAAVSTEDGRSMVIIDLPVDANVAARIEERTGTQMGHVSVSFADDPLGPDEDEAIDPHAKQLAYVPVQPSASTQVDATQSNTPFQKTVAMMTFTRWTVRKTGPVGQISVSLGAPFMRLYDRVASAQSAAIGEGLILVLVVLAALFIIVQGSALVGGAALAHSITYAVHELFVGTERVRRGDFSHRIRIETKDQLGDLADSFNRMSGSMEHYLHVQREKQRLDDELRIARDIQKSLLPSQPPKIAGLSIADLCEPAREVGGDYYDFFDLGPRQLGILIADVSGKGTSAALYMAELKGLMLALSHTESSPRKLLVTVNHLLAEHLDNRSFITATYAVIDLDAMTLTHARAGHTPLIVVSDGESEVIVPSGMVLGLRLPGASERFETLLEEHTRPLMPGDVIVFYTDGITEATDVSGELFGDTALTRVLNGPSDLDAAAIRERVVRDVQAFVGDAEPHDDMTMVVVKLQ